MSVGKGLVQQTGEDREGKEEETVHYKQAWNSKDQIQSKSPPNW